LQSLMPCCAIAQELGRRVPESHSGRQELEQAEELVRSVARGVDTSMMEEMLQMHRILEPLGADYMKILAPHRNVIHECECEFVIEACRFPAAIYVLTDLLLVVKRGKGGRIKPRLLMWHTKMLIGEELTEGDRGQQFRGLLSAPGSRWLINLATDDHRECFRAEFPTAAGNVASRFK